ncbi:MAG: hypothetical protein H0A75_08290 [Candidatus Methanofishera endochildressiae]|uniref:MGS-like domain-containing protein n=1 Tax=Candidatus Methanofishera endochildressiae TaxID=2738884 RepID=A0A7Z0MQ66_9GAMM|nr:hypothetical protein [Candidatus Methanofishera endochildressiae]
MKKKVNRALISVSNKTGVLEFCRELDQLGIELLSTGGTARLLADNDINVTEVSDYTGFPEMMDGRVKTLHPKIHGGILGRRGIDDQVMADSGIKAIDMVVVNLYPFAETVAKPDCDSSIVAKNIDIGTSMTKNAAKNHIYISAISWQPVLVVE